MLVCHVQTGDLVLLAALKQACLIAFRNAWTRDLELQLGAYLLLMDQERQQVTGLPQLNLGRKKFPKL